MSLSTAGEVATVDMLDAQRDRHKRHLKRNMSSAEDMFRTAMRDGHSLEPNDVATPGGPNNRWRISDRCSWARCVCFLLAGSAGARMWGCSVTALIGLSTSVGPASEAEVSRRNFGSACLAASAPAQASKTSRPACRTASTLQHVLKVEGDGRLY